MPNRFAMRFSEDLLAMLEQFTGAEVPTVITDNPYIVLEFISDTEFNLKLMSEDQMLAAYTDDSTLHILN